MANERSLISRAKSAMSSDWYNLTAEDRIGSALKQFGENIEKRREENEQVKMYKGNELDDTYATLMHLLGAADTPESLKIFEKNRAKFSSESLTHGGFEDNIVQAETLKMLGNKKKKMHGDFSMAIKNTNEELLQSDNF